ncbi:hypothetical protein QE377_000451 [Microbacterium sp. SORGH_AS 862]|nr:hypothetical protein [Microbacterium sp. SORGH_AS_0862]
MWAVSIAANGAWIQIRAYGENSNEWVAQLAEDVAERAFQFAPPQRAGRDGPDAGWWALRDCDWVETIAVPDGVTTPPEPSGADSELVGLYAEVRRGRAGFSTDCTWHVLVGSELGSVAGDVGVSIVPGGAQFFDRIAASDGAQLISVDGADRAATVRGLERLEGYDTRLVVASGENLLMISGDNGVPPESLAYLVEPYLTALNATLG